MINVIQQKKNKDGLLLHTMSTVFIRIEVPFRIEAPPARFQRETKFCSNLTFIDGDILPHAVNILYENIWVTGIS